MCVGILIPGNIARPSPETFHLCEKANPHGGGYAVATGTKVEWVKGVTAARVIELLKETPVECTVMVHFRIPTVGGQPSELCHPFPITKNAEATNTGSANEVLFHNGHWTDWKDAILPALGNRKLPTGPWSDSRAMAIYANRWGTNALELICANQRIGTMKGDGSSMIYGDWKTIDGVYYTNLNWKPSVATTAVRYYGGWDDGDGVRGYTRRKQHSRVLSTQDMIDRAEEVDRAEVARARKEMELFPTTDETEAKKDWDELIAKYAIKEDE